MAALSRADPGVSSAFLFTVSYSRTVINSVLLLHVLHCADAFCHFCLINEYDDDDDDDIVLRHYLPCI